MESTTTRPEFCTDEMLVFLDELRESGVTNMFGAAPYLNEEFPEELGEQRSFGRSTREAQAVLSYWMKSFGKEDR